MVSGFYPSAIYGLSSSQVKPKYMQLVFVAAFTLNT